MSTIDQLGTLLTGRIGVAALLALAVLALLFLVLWLRARGARGGAGAGPELRAARNEAKMLSGDLIQARHDHAAEVEKLNRELENLRAVAGGRMPPELDEWRRRAQVAEARAATERADVEAHYRARVDELERELGSSLGQTMIAPNIHALHEQSKILGQELADARRQLAEAESRHQAELKALAERLSAEKAAALTALAARLEAGLPERRAAVAVGDLEGGPAEGAVPDSARFPFLELVEGGAEIGTRYYLPYGKTTIGRDASNTIALEEQRASRFHAEIEFDGVEFVVRNRGSLNGTFVNDKKTPIESARLELGDVIGIGDLFWLRFGCVADDLAGKDPGRAAAAYRAMIAVAPNFRAAQQQLASLLEHDEGARDKAAALEERMSMPRRTGREGAPQP